LALVLQAADPRASTRSRRKLTKSYFNVLRTGGEASVTHKTTAFRGYERVSEVTCPI
jgi:hypothetical protein